MPKSGDLCDHDRAATGLPGRQKRGLLGWWIAEPRLHAALLTVGFDPLPIFRVDLQGNAAAVNDDTF